MINHENGMTTIQCDKCKKTSSSATANYNVKFALEEWYFNRYGVKYKHICYDCLSAKKKRARDFVSKKLNLK